MKTYKMNKNVEHNGKPYPLGMEIKEGEANCKLLVEAGHASEIKVQAVPYANEEKKTEVVIEAPVEKPPQFSKGKQSKR